LFLLFFSPYDTNKACVSWFNNNIRLTIEDVTTQNYKWKSWTRLFLLIQQTLNVLLNTYTTKITCATQQDHNKDIWLSQFGHDKTQIALWWLAFNSYFYNCSRNSNTLTSHTNFIMMFQLSFGSSSSYNNPLILNLMLTWHFKPKS